MDFLWTPHRFSGGLLALDVANSVILRATPERSIDRFEHADAIAAFASAATTLCAEPLPTRLLMPPADRAAFLALREAIDRYFRQRVEGADDAGLLADLLDAAARTLRLSPNGADLGASTARSALRLAARADDGRLKICANCGWLFFDRSKNRSRAWCDMTVCGNRRKASRHYRRAKDGGAA
ncbi:putative RNA-binding Zn ribbon-like protein [Rhizobium sp. PP-F2F-G48]|uniref:CGNR zinc finger domain-containing protein n=1 Tax=Rhizobium sp. PP-F2F-G48 TaxID=2135651 RepID=UPI00104BF32A|nr:CGNR zinc finger domain-containing protein [Rhizobium sp. PP-F2F-G48]TCM57671.1 putative RNA-binding Zn ribbon-like protein [Rhizobium sp. PP-F2F-G48]